MNFMLDIEIQATALLLSDNQSRVWIGQRQGRSGHDSLRRKRKTAAQAPAANNANVEGSGTG